MTEAVADIVEPGQLRSEAERLARAGEADAALDLCQRVLAARPDDIEARLAIADIAMERGLGDVAETLIRECITLQPEASEPHLRLGRLQEARGRLSEALAAFAAAAERGDTAEAYAQVARALAGAGQDAAAVDAAKASLAVAPGNPTAWHTLGMLSERARRLDDAVACYERVLAAAPDAVGALHNLGRLRLEQRRYDEAVGYFHRAVQIAPTPEGLCNLASGLENLGRDGEALEVFSMAESLAPDLLLPQIGMGRILNTAGRVREAERHLRRALELAPAAPDVYSQLLMALVYDEATSPEQLLELARGFAARFEAPLPPLPPPPPHANPRDPDRRLRIGYVSPDLRNHVTAMFLEGVLESHDRAHFEVYCYGEVAAADQVTERLWNNIDGFRYTTGAGDDDLAATIRSDGIDILIDLAGHTGGNRLPVFARRPAPIQFTWLGYPGTTGLTGIDGLIIGDHFVAPEHERHFSERIVRLPGIPAAYRSSSEVPAPVAPPSLANGHATFACFNNPIKLSASACRVFGRILAALPDARLLLKYAKLNQDSLQRAIAERFPEEVRSRLIFEGRSPTREYLQRYSDVDIALDPFPYNGGTTTFDLLSVGVPMVALEGDRYPGRIGSSLLRLFGLDELVAADEGAYVDLAIRLAQDSQQLSDLRLRVRQRFEAARLEDAAPITRHLEAALRTAWRTWCEHGEDWRQHWVLR